VKERTEQFLMIIRLSVLILLQHYNARKINAKKMSIQILTIKMDFSWPLEP